MHPIHDADLLLMLATTLASKRKPATVADIALALGMLQPRLPAEDKLLEAFERLTSHGLIVAGDDGYALSIEGEAVMQGVPRKGETADRAAQLKGRLNECKATARHAPSRPDASVLSAAIEAWRATLPPPTKSDKVELQREKRFEEANAKRIAEGKRPRPPMSAGPKRPNGAAGAKRGPGHASPRGPGRGQRGR